MGKENQIVRYQYSFLVRAVFCRRASPAAAGLKRPSGDLEHVERVVTTALCSCLAVWRLKNGPEPKLQSATISTESISVNFPTDMLAPPTSSIFSFVHGTITWKNRAGS